MDAVPLIPAAVWASLLAGLVTTLSIMIARRFGDWGRDNAVYFASFAAGVLIAVSFLHLMPKSIELSAKAQCSCLLGIC